jgi:hypothetical protein
MPFGSQKTNVQAVTDIGGLVHTIYVGDVLPAVRFESVTSQMFQNAPEGAYRYDGASMTFAVDLELPSGALASGGALPDSVYTDAVNGLTTPVRRYVRRAVDNFTEARAVKGDGSFADLGTRMFDQMWSAFRLMEIRHAVGGASGTLCTVDSRTSSTIWVATAGYGFAGANPLLHLSKGMIIAWHDASAAFAAAGAGKIAAINYATNAVTMASAATWEPAATTANGDAIVAATTGNITTDYFDTERNNAKNGLLSIVDPAGALSTVFNIAEGTHQRWKPYRKASVTFDHLEVTEFMRKLAAKSSFPVNPSSHTLLGSPALVAELARSLVGFQQQQQLGKVLEGGYQTVNISGWDIAEDEYQIPNVMYALCNEDLYTVSLVEAGYFDEDGSMYERISDYDGKSWWVRDYCNSFSPRRNRHGALTNITLGVTASDFDAVPNY